MVVVAHRLSTAARADRIAVVDDGRIAEVGTHDELIAHEGRYASLYAAWDSRAAMGRSGPKRPSRSPPRALDLAEHDAPDQGAEAADEPPVPRELAARLGVGARDAGLGRDRRPSSGALDDDEVPRRLREPGLVEAGELVGLDAVDAAGELPELPDDAEHELAIRLLGEHDEAGLDDVVETELALRLHRAREQVREPAGEQQREDDRGAREVELLDGAERLVDRCVDVDRVVLDDVVVGQELVDQHASTFAPGVLGGRSGAVSRVCP